MTSQMVVVTLGLAALVVVGVLVANALRNAACREEGRLTERREQAERAAEQRRAEARQHQIAVLGTGAVEEVTMVGDYLTAKLIREVPDGARVANAANVAGGAGGGILSFRHTRPGGSTEWSVARETPATPPPAPQAGVINNIYCGREPQREGEVPTDDAGHVAQIRRPDNGGGD